MSFRDRIRGALAGWRQPQAAAEQNIPVMTSEQLLEYLRRGMESATGALVNETTVMRVATAWRCVHIIAGAIATMPLDLVRRVSEKERQPAVGHPLRRVLTVRPNQWQTPSEFKRMMQAHLLLRGKAYARKVRSMGQVSALIPLQPDRVQAEQNADGTMRYEYSAPDGRVVPIPQRDMFHLRGMTLDGVNGLSVLAAMREAVGLALRSEEAAARVFKQGYLSGGALTHPGKLGDKAYERLKESLDSKHSGAEQAGRWMLLEEGLKPEQLGFSAQDMQMLEARDFQRYDIAMFFGVPPPVIGLTTKVSSWGTGVEQQGIGFVTYTLGDWITTWQETIKRDLIDEREWDTLDAKIYTAGLMRGDLKGRGEFYVKMLQWTVLNPDEVRAFEDWNPRADGKGGEYLTPPNTAGEPPASEPEPDPDPAKDPNNAQA